MKTTKTYCAIIGATTLLATQNLFASLGSLTITDPQLGSGDVNGPYVVNVQSGPLSTPFETFCLAYNVDYYNGGKYNYDISTAVNPQASGDTGNGLAYVTVGTAWIYEQFLANSYPSSTYNIGGNLYSGDAIQQVIWYLQGQTAAPLNASGASTLLSNVEGLANYHSDNAGAGSIYALNLEVGSGSGYAGAAPGDFTAPDGTVYAQPQLCYYPGGGGSDRTPIPEPSTIFAGALLLVPFGISALRILRKDKQV